MFSMFGDGVRHHALRRVRLGRRVVVQPWERALLIRRGVVVSVLDPGSRRVWSTGNEVMPVDMRPWIVSVLPQEIPTSDAVTVKVSATAHAQVIDPQTSHLASQDLHAELHASIQQTLRDVVGASTLQELISERPRVAEALAARLGSFEALGVTVGDLQLRDVVLPADLKRAQAQVLLARAEGQAALERARGETAALRALANAARLTAETPTLYQLRLLQQLAASTGHTVVIGGSGGVGGGVPS